MAVPLRNLDKAVLRGTKGALLVVLCFLSWTNFRAAARAVRRRKPQAMCRRFHSTCTAQGTAAKR